MSLLACLHHGLTHKYGGHECTGCALSSLSNNVNTKLQCQMLRLAMLSGDDTDDDSNISLLGLSDIYSKHERVVGIGPHLSIPSKHEQVVGQILGQLDA